MDNTSVNTKGGKNMIVVTGLDIWRLGGSAEEKAGTGNQSLYNTLLGYAGHGYNVHVFTTGISHKDLPAIHPNVHINRVTIKSYKLLKKVKLAVLRLIGLFRKKEESASTKSIQTKPPKEMSGLGVAFYSHLFTWEMTRYAKKAMRNIDVAFVYGHEINGVLAAARISRIMRLPLITRFQGAHIGQFLNDPDTLFKHSVYVRALKAPANLVIMANDGTEGDKLLDFLGVPKGKYRFYMNGVVKDDVYRPDVDVTEIRKKARVPAGNLFLLYAGRFFYFKRIDRLLRVFAKALGEYPEMTLVLIGDGIEKEPCEDLVNKLGIANNVVFLGSLPHSEVMDYLNACDIYTAFYDLSNLSNSMIESCVCGKCIVTTAVGGTTDLLTDGINAVVVKKHDDEEAITQALVKVLKDPVERARLAEGAWQRGSELKTWTERMDMEVTEVEAILAQKQ